MATTRAVPANYPQPLGSQMLRADGQRHISMLRQEILTELLSMLTEAHEPAIRSRLTRLIESQLRSGFSALQRAENLWPDSDEAREVIGGSKLKPAVQKRHLKLFDRLDRVQRRSWDLLNDSFANVRLILDRVQSTARLERAPSPASEQRGANRSAGSGR
jgi:hypothetical protein